MTKRFHLLKAFLTYTFSSQWKALFAQFIVIEIIKEFHYSLQWLSELSYYKLSFESILIMIYGFDRCASDEFSTILYGFNIEDKKFWPNVRKLFIILIVLKLIALIALILKTNSFTKRAKVNETQISFEESKSKLNII
jgi:hypothetical protein